MIQALGDERACGRGHLLALLIFLRKAFVLCVVLFGAPPTDDCLAPSLATFATLASFAVASLAYGGDVVVVVVVASSPVVHEFAGIAVLARARPVPVSAGVALAPSCRDVEGLGAALPAIFEIVDSLSDRNKS